VKSKKNEKVVVVTRAEHPAGECRVKSEKHEESVKGVKGGVGIDDRRLTDEDLPAAAGFHRRRRISQKVPAFTHAVGVRRKGTVMRGKAAESFEELHVCQRARELTNAVYALTRGPLFSRDSGLVDQIRRASVSIMSNIAEGFERGTTTEFVQHLYVAKGSSGEVRAQLQIALDQGCVQAVEHERLHDLCRAPAG
jgi:four helix bundle protein